MSHRSSSEFELIFSLGGEDSPAINVIELKGKVIAAIREGEIILVMNSILRLYFCVSVFFWKYSKRR